MHCRKALESIGSQTCCQPSTTGFSRNVRASTHAPRLVAEGNYSSQQRITSLPGCETTEIRAPIVVRLLIFSPKARGYAYKTGYGGHARAVCVRSSFPVPEIVRKNREFARIAHKRPTGRAPSQSLHREMGVLGSAERLDRGCASERQISRLCGLQRPKFARRGCAADEPWCHAVHGEGERRDGLPRELPCAGTARIGSL